MDPSISQKINAAIDQNTTIAIPFIKYDVENQEFRVHHDAVDFLSKLEGKIGIIAVCGKYRTGKSYLLNKLFMETLNHGQNRNSSSSELSIRKDRQSDIKSQDYPQINAAKGFQVGPTINPCTKGLWIWKQVFYSDKDVDKELPIIIVDTEGLGAFDEEQNHDTKIFLLALLLSSLLIYNSMGPIDENAISNLSLVVNLSQSLQIKKGEKDMDPDEMAQYFPSFLWILRDFALRLEDQHGNSLTQSDYLENSLQEQKGMSDAIEQKNRIRRLIKQFFQDRDCHTIVRPVEEEKMLQTLNDVNPQDLRQEFVKQIDQLRRKIFRKVKPKQIRGQNISGQQLLELAESYIEALNKGGIPVIETAWQYLQSNELENAFKETLDLHQKLIDTKIKELLPMNTEQLKKLFSLQKEECFQNFKEKTLGDIKNQKNQSYIRKLKTEFKNRQAFLMKKNIDQIKFVSRQIFDNLLSMSVHQKFQQNLYNNLNDMHADFKYVQQEFINQLQNSLGLGQDIYALKQLHEMLHESESLLAMDIFKIQTTNLANQYTILQQSSQSATQDNQNLKQQLKQIKKELGEEIKNLDESKKALQSQLSACELKIANKDEVIDKLQRRLTSNDKEMQRALDDTVKRLRLAEQKLEGKENEIRDLMQQFLRNEADLKKQLALMEQKVDFQWREQQELKERMQINGEQSQVKNQEIKEFTELIKELRKENKGLKGQIKESNEKLSVQSSNCQYEIQLKERAIEESDRIKKENQELAKKKLSLEGYIIKEQDSYANLNKKYNELQRQFNKQQKSQEDIELKIIQNSEQILRSEELENVNQQLSDANQSIKVLRRIKNAYKQAQSLQCRGCNLNFQPVIFKAHVMNCQELLSDPESFRDLAQATDIDQLHIKAQSFDSELNINFNVKSSQNSTKFQRNILDLNLSLKIEEVQNLLLYLAETYQNVDVFKDRLFEKVIMLDEQQFNISVELRNARGDLQEERNIKSKIEQDKQEIIKNINSVIFKMINVFAVKSDLKFKKLFGLIENAQEGQDDAKKKSATKQVSVSLLRQVRQEQNK